MTELGFVEAGVGSTGNEGDDERTAAVLVERELRRCLAMSDHFGLRATANAIYLALEVLKASSR